jgi:hypothetical protein
LVDCREIFHRRVVVNDRRGIGATWRERGEQKLSRDAGATLHTYDSSPSRNGAAGERARWADIVDVLEAWENSTGD